MGIAERRITCSVIGVAVAMQKLSGVIHDSVTVLLVIE